MTNAISQTSTCTDVIFTQSPGAVVLLHDKVAGSVPEPASAGLLIVGTLLLRAMRRRGFEHRLRTVANHD